MDWENWTFSVRPNNHKKKKIMGENDDDDKNDDTLMPLYLILCTKVTFTLDHSTGLPPVAKDVF